MEKHPKTLIIRSIETAGGERCVDIFRRFDGTFGYGVYRRDPEDARGWFALGDHGGLTFESEAAALAAAARQEPWLMDASTAPRH